MSDTGQYLTVTLYAPSTGMILGVRTGQRESIECEELPYIEGAYSAAEYYVKRDGSLPTMHLRPKQETRQGKGSISADGKDAFVLSGLPVPCVVQIGEHRYEVEDGGLEWSTLMPGTYHIRVEAFPFLDWDAEVIAIASVASPNDG